jgi:hypothetical protein
MNLIPCQFAGCCWHTGCLLYDAQSIIYRVEFAIDQQIDKKEKAASEEPGDRWRLQASYGELTNRFAESSGGR